MNDPSRPDPPRRGAAQGEGAPVRPAALAFILITVALDMLALGLVLPVLPALVTDLVHGDLARAALVYGGFVMAWEGAQLLFAPLLGALSDRFGRRPVVLLSNAGLGLDYVFMAVTSSLSLLLVGRILSGITAASLPAASAYVSDVTPPEKRAAAFGMIGAAFGVGFVVGPALGGWLGSIAPRLPFWVAAGLSLSNALYGFWVLPESLPKEKRSRFDWKRAHPLGALTLLRTQTRIRELVGVVFVSNVAHFVLQSTFVLYAGYRYGWSPTVIGGTLTAMGVCVVIVQGGLVRPIVARLGERRTLLLGLAFGVAGFALYGAASSSVAFWLGIPFAILWGISTPALQALVTRRTSPAHQGELQGTMAAAAAMAGLVGPPLFTQIFAWVVARPERAAWMGAPFFAAATLLLLALVLAAHASKEIPGALEREGGARHDETPAAPG